MSNLGNKEVMAKNIQYYMDRLGIDRRKLSADLSISYTTLTDWLKAKTYPRIDKIEMLANYFSISKAELVEERQPSTTLAQITDTSAKLEEPKQKEVLFFAKDKLEEQLQEKITSTPSDPLGKVVQFPSKSEDSTTSQEEIEETISYGAVSAGTGEYLFGLERAETVWLPKRKFPSHPFDYVLKINGDSMEPTFRHGEYIFVKSFVNGGEVRDGMLAIVLYDNEVYFKKLYIEPDQARLVSLNKDYPDVVITDPKEFTVLGQVVL